jgi:hypothetical protein
LGWKWIWMDVHSLPNAVAGHFVNKFDARRAKYAFWVPGIARKGNTTKRQFACQCQHVRINFALK